MTKAEQFRENAEEAMQWCRQSRSEQAKKLRGIGGLTTAALRVGLDIKVYTVAFTGCVRTSPCRVQSLSQRAAAAGWAEVG